MNKKLIFILSIISIILLSLLSNQIKITGKITKINYYPEKTEINLNNSNETIIIFTNKIINLSENNTIKITGTRETYKNTNQIIADKVELIK